MRRSRIRGGSTLGSPITELSEDSDARRAVAVREVPGTLEVFATHFPRFPVLPGVLILADLVEVATLVLRNARPGGWRLAAVTEVRWRHYVRPGDRMELTVTRLDQQGADEVFSGAVRVGGRVVMTIGDMRLAPAPHS